MLLGIKHVARNSQRHGRRLLFLSDSMCCVLSFAKGRCHSAPLLRYCQRVAAEALASGLRISWRWIPSASNVADAPSRLWERFRRHESRAIDEGRVLEALDDRAFAYIYDVVLKGLQSLIGTVRH